MKKYEPPKVIPSQCPLFLPLSSCFFLFSKSSPSPPNSQTKPKGNGGGEVGFQIEVCDGDLGRNIMVFVIVKTATRMLLRRIGNFLAQFSTISKM